MVSFAVNQGAFFLAMNLTEGHALPPLSLFGLLLLELGSRVQVLDLVLVTACASLTCWIQANKIRLPKPYSTRLKALLDPEGPIRNMCIIWCSLLLRPFAAFLRGPVDVYRRRGGGGAGDAQWHLEPADGCPHPPLSARKN